MEEACGPIQVCGVHSPGAETAIHAIEAIFQAEKTEAVILVDATGAFNSVNGPAALYDIQITCPSISTVLIDSYRDPSRFL